MYLCVCAGRTVSVSVYVNEMAGIYETYFEVGTKQAKIINKMIRLCIIRIMLVFHVFHGICMCGGGGGILNNGTRRKKSNDMIVSVFGA